MVAIKIVAHFAKNCLVLPNSSERTYRQLSDRILQNYDLFSRLFRFAFPKDHRNQVCALGGLQRRKGQYCVLCCDVFNLKAKNDKL